jgi:hypothetical protein
LRFLTRDGVPFEGATFTAAAEALRATSRVPGQDLAEFMRETAHRAELQTGAVVYGHNAFAFLSDLETAGLVERLS